MSGEMCHREKRQTSCVLAGGADTHGPHRTELGRGRWRLGRALEKGVWGRMERI